MTIHLAHQTNGRPREAGHARGQVPGASRRCTRDPGGSRQGVLIGGAKPGNAGLFVWQLEVPLSSSTVKTSGAPRCARIGREPKEDPTRVLAEISLTVSDAVRFFLGRVVITRGRPFEFHVSNGCMPREPGQGKEEWMIPRPPSIPSELLMSLTGTTSPSRAFGITWELAD